MNLVDVARRARVSTATVSRVLNGATGVRPATRERVEKAVASLGYTPNLIARTLAGGHSRSIGMIVSNLENPFFLDIFHGVEVYAQRQGYEILVANTHYSPDRLMASVELMRARRVSGIALVVSESMPPEVATLAGRDTPVVSYDGNQKRFPQSTNIRANYEAGMRQIVEYLYALGHRRMAFVGHHVSLSPLDARKQAFLAVTRDFAPRVKIMTVADDDGLAGGQRAMQEILATDFRPTAIACVNDIMAIGALRELRANGLSVPEDVSVTGFDNITLAEFASPSLTTADIPRAEVGRLIVESLLRRPITRHTRGGEIVIQPELIVRSSTAPAPSRSRTTKLIRR